MKRNKICLSWLQEIKSQPCKWPAEVVPKSWGPSGAVFVSSSFGFDCPHLLVTLDKPPFNDTTRSHNLISCPALAFLGAVRSPSNGCLHRLEEDPGVKLFPLGYLRQPAKPTSLPHHQSIQFNAVDHMPFCPVKAASWPTALASGQN